MSPESRRTRAAVERFNEAFARHDVDDVMSAMTPDCVFESTAPPDGERHEGQTAVRACWEALFSAAPAAVIEAEEMTVLGDRAVVRWRYQWGEPDDRDGHVRGVDLFRVQGDKVAEKLAYVKG